LPERIAGMSAARHAAITKNALFFNRTSSSDRKLLTLDSARIVPIASGGIFSLEVVRSVR
jgi:hypothetical protein